MEPTGNQMEKEKLFVTRRSSVTSKAPEGSRVSLIADEDYLR